MISRITRTLEAAIMLNRKQIRHCENETIHKNDLP